MFKKLILGLIALVVVGMPLSYIGVAALFWNNEYKDALTLILAPGLTLASQFKSCSGSYWSCFVQVQAVYYGVILLVVYTICEKIYGPFSISWQVVRTKKSMLLNIAVVFIALFVAVTTARGVRKSMSEHYFTGDDRKLEAAVLANDIPAITQALAQGANANARGTHGVTPLMLAVDRLNKSAVVELLARGADPNCKAEDGNSAVSLAVENYRHSPEIFFAVMKAGGNPNMRRPDDDPVIIRFVNDHNCEYIRHMKDFGADLDITTRGNDPIITDAGLTADWDVVWCLIELGAKYDYESTAREPLSLALAADFPSPDSPIYPYKKKVWQFLHDQGIKVKPLK